MNTHNAYVAYYQANPEQDPYRAYGGYSNYMQYYYAHMFQQQNSPAPAGANAPPPPPSEPANSASAVPPPPPPPAGSPGGYSAVSCPRLLLHHLS
jgi:homoaconitase